MLPVAIRPPYIRLYILLKRSKVSVQFFLFLFKVLLKPNETMCMLQQLHFSFHWCCLKVSRCSLTVVVQYYAKRHKIKI